jgi:hypothetical protein
VHTVIARRTHHNNARSDHRSDKRSHILVELPQSQPSKRHVDHNENRITAATTRRLLQNVIGTSGNGRKTGQARRVVKDLDGHDRGIAGHTHGPTRHVRAVGAHVLALDKRSAAVIVGDKTIVQATRGAMGVEIRHGAARLVDDIGMTRISNSTRSFCGTTNMNVCDETTLHHPET